MFSYPTQNTDTWKDDIIAALQPLVDPHHRKSAQQAANRLIQIGIATIIVLEYSACLSLRTLERVKSAVNYYLQSPTAVAVEEGEKEISCQRYKKEKLEKKILEFIIENRMSKELIAKK
ncbi:hypothetical protein CY34DRAFT_15873 [Suillus luteus UH-Slu-Lm8-n1]|uniref:Unplaced genomic scaffold CY34scaffold_338, whole genome shotgun sequence n=1 Tax=Suillus luteus UH-Slu-Lm8-n1 TaxID=930992 RepID=A0A0D0A6I4_9AGAM|nr:hypothetical protein CY34DRAFT_15873 [Suillus luteus UH-Slu-Lm8-n1]